MKRRNSGDGKRQTAPETIIEEISAGARGDDERFRAFLKAIEDGVSVPFDGFVIGEPVAVLSFNYDGNTRRGLTATCRREDGAEHVVSVVEIAIPPKTAGESLLAAYRRWLGMDACRWNPGDLSSARAGTKPRRPTSICLDGSS